MRCPGFLSLSETHWKASGFLEIPGRYFFEFFLSFESVCVCANDFDRAGRVGHNARRNAAEQESVDSSANVARADENAVGGQSFGFGEQNAFRVARLDGR